MMTKLLGIMIILSLSASCSKSSQNASQPVPLEAPNVIELSALNVSTFPDGNFAEVNMDFASLSFKQSATQELIILNASNQSINYLSSDFDFEEISPFEIVSNGCIQNLVARRKCSIQIKLSNLSSLADAQSLSASFKVKDTEIMLSGILQKDMTDYTAPVAGIVVSPTYLDFGSMTQGKLKELSVIVSNTTTQNIPIVRDAFSNPRTSVTSSTCNATLGSRRSCSFKVQYSAEIIESIANQNLFKMANNQVTYSVSVNNDLLVNNSIQPMSNSADLTLLPPGQSSGSVQFINNSGSTFAGPITAESSSPAVQINSISCSSGLSRSKQCSVSYNVNSSLLSAGQSTQSIKLKSGQNISLSFSLNLSILEGPVACSVENATANGVSFTNSNNTVKGNALGANVSECLLADNACNSHYSRNLSGKSCDAIVSVCLPADATANGVSFINSNNAVKGNVVAGDMSACLLADAACNLNYIRNSSGKSCDAIVTACLPADATSNGVIFSNSNNTVKGNVVAGDKSACLLADDACNQYHVRNISGKSCDFVSAACTLQNAPDFNVNLNNVATVLGNTPNCIVSSCSVSTHEPSPAIGANSCQEKSLLSPSFSFVKTHSNSLTNDVVATATNASKILIYNGDNCMASPVEYSLPLTVLVTPIQADGTVRYSAQFKNVNNLSSCINASYEYDTVVTGNLLANNLDSAPKSSVISQSVSLSATGSDIVFTKSMVTSESSCSSVDLSSRSEIAIGTTQSISPLANSLSRVCAIGKDLAGNWQSTPVDLGTMMVDSSAPTTIATFSHATYFNSTTQSPVLTWTSSSDTLSGLNRYEISIGSTPGAVNILNWQSVGLVNSIQLNANLAAYSNQTVYAQIRAVDNVGNNSLVKISSGWYVGQPAIDISIAYPTASDKIKISNAAAFEVRGACSEIGRNVSIKIGSLAAQTAVCAGTAPNGTYSKFINTTTLADGSRVVEVTHDNSFAISRTVSVTVQKDTIAPTVGFTSPANSSSYALPGNSSFSISGTCSETGIPVKISSSFEFTMDATCTAAHTFQFNVNLSEQTVTSITIFATQSDSAGNIAQEVSLNLTNGNFTRLLTGTLSQTEQPIHGISTPLGDGSLGKVLHLINARNDAEAALAISNIDGTEFTVLTNQVGNAAVSVFSALQGENNDRLGVYSETNESIYFRQRIPNTNAIGLYAVGLDGEGYRQILGSTSAHPDSEVIQLFVGGAQNDKLIFIADREINDDYEVYMSDLTGNSIVKLSGTLAVGGDITGIWPVSNSDRIIYFGDQDADFKFDLYSVKLDGTGRVKLTPEPIGYADGQDRRPAVYVFTHNGQYVVYSYDYKADEVFSLFSAKIDGTTAPVALNSLDADMEILGNNRFEVSPDQTKVLFVADDTNGVGPASGQGNGVSNIFTVNIDGTNRMRISRNMSSSRDVSVGRWSKDSQLVYWYADMGGADNQFNFFKAKSTVPYTDTVNSGFVQLTNFGTYTSPGSLVINLTPTYFPNQKDAPTSLGFRVSADGSKIIFVCDFRNDLIVNHDLCSISTSGVSATTATALNVASTNETSNIVGLILPDSPSDNRVIYLLDPEIDAKHEIFISTNDGSVKNKISAPISFSAGAVTSTRDYFSVDWNNEKILYSLNDINANKYGFSSSLSSYNHVKFGEPIVVSDVNSSFVINNRVVFLADANSANKAELFSTALDGTGLVKLNSPIGNNGTISNYAQVGSTNKVVYVVAPSDTSSAQVHVVDITNPASDINLTPGFQINAEISAYMVSPDGQYVVFITDANIDEVDELYAVKLDGTGSPIRLNPTGWTGSQDVSSFVIAPNSRTVAVYSDARIESKPEYYISNIDTPSWINITTVIQPNTTTGVKDGTSTQVTGTAVFSADSSRVCYVGDLYINGDFDLYCADTNGLSPLQIASLGSSETSTLMNIVSVSTDPNNTKVIIRSDVEVDNQNALYSMNFDMSNIIKLTTDLGNTIYSATHNATIADTYDQTGSKLIFRADLEVSNKFELYSVNLDGTSLTKLNQPLEDYNDVHSYLIASNRVVYLADVASTPRRVYSYNLSNNTRIPISNFSISKGQAFSYSRADAPTRTFWGNNIASQWIAINANGNSENVIDCYLSRADGVGGLKKISPNLAPYSFGCNSVRISPSFDKAYFQADTQSFGIVDLFLQSLSP